MDTPLTLDFRNCKSVEDVEKVFKKKKPELGMIARIIDRTDELTKKELGSNYAETKDK